MLRSVICVLAIVGQCGLAPAGPVVALLTDFGLANEAVGQCHGAILSQNADIEVVDLCHSVDSYDIQLAALMLGGSTGFPKGTVFVAVVDPGVGTERQPIALRSKNGHFYVGPNNGVFTKIMRDQGIDAAVAINAKAVNPKWEPGTFDGRDLFSPAGAQLATSGDLAKIGSPIDASKLVTIDIPAAKVDASKGAVSGIFLRVDEPYGNLWTNISRDDLTSAGIKIGDELNISIGGKKLKAPFVVSFGHVEKGKPLAYLNSNASLSVAINMGNFVKEHNLERGAAIVIKKK